MSEYPSYPAFNVDLPVDLGSVCIEFDGTITVNENPATVKDLKAARDILDLALQARWALSAIDDAEKEAEQAVLDLSAPPRFSTQKETEEITQQKQQARSPRQ